MDEEKIMAESSSHPPLLTDSPLMPSLSTTPSTSNSYSPKTPVSPTSRTFEIAEEESPTPFTKLEPKIHDVRTSETSVTTSDNGDRSASYRSLTEELEKHESTNAEDISHEIRSANWTIGGTAITGMRVQER